LVEQKIIIINAILDSVVLMTYLFLILTLTSKKPLLSISVVAYDTILGILSSVIKNINLDIFMTYSFLITSIFMIDFYIVLTMTSLYSKLRYIRIKKGG
jgi:type IV secretory pathway TrbL component